MVKLSADITESECEETRSSCDDEEGPSPCTVCETEVDTGVQCEWCDRWSHFECINLNMQSVLKMMSHESVFFICKVCLDFHEAFKVGIKAFCKRPECERKSDVIKEVVNLMSADEKDSENVVMVGDQKACSTYVEALKKDLSSVKNDVAELKRCMNEKLSVVGDAILESREKERRVTNVILHQVPESNDNEENDAKKSDAKLVNEVFNCLGLDDLELHRVFRLGPKRSDGKSRLLLVDVGSKDKRDSILRWAPNLRKAESLSKIFVCEDRTPAEQERMRNLVKEKNEKVAQDPEHFYVIRNFRIVCLKKHAGAAAMGVMGGGTSSTAS